MKIAIGTKNQAKNKAVQNICMSLINQPEFISLDVSSNVSAQPFGDEETLEGAKNRAIQACIEEQVNISFGLEGGVKELDGQLFICNWGVLQTAEGEQYIAGGAQLPLPQDVALAVRNGEELGPVMERYTNQTGIRQNEGAVGIFTSNIVKRADMFEHIVKLLLGQYLKDHPSSKMT
jgi:inosine/xanthosine triphosphatase